MNYQDQYYQPCEKTVPYESLSTYTAKTFAWMFLGLMITFVVSIAGYLTGYVFYLYTIPYAVLILGILELAVVIYLSAKITKLSVGAARALFLMYAVLNGVVFSAYFWIYDVESMVFAFGATALFFGGMAVFGLVTKADLSILRNFLTGSLIFLLIFWALSMFINLESFETAICAFGMFIFLAFTAYDTRKIRDLYQTYANDPVMAKKASVISALQLYLDFINLFLYLIQLVGNKRK